MKSRQIKFRVWDKVRKTFSYPEDKETNYSEPTENGGLGYYLLTQSGILQSNDGNYIDDWHDNYIIQQYTGFCDKHGKEIYEGDLIKFMGRWDEQGNVLTPDYKPYEVIWFMGGLHAIWTEKSARSFHVHNQMVGVGHTDSEIIGNILETPELFK